MGDTGLLITQIMKNSDGTMEDLYKSIIFDKLGINQGTVIENVVAQMLRAKGYDLYFHEFMHSAEGAEKDKKYEIDFLIVRKRKVCPIEVKSSSYKNHKSFDLFAKKYPIKLEDKFIIYAKDLKYEEGVLYIPLYMTMCL